jgi:hypothetical protein
MVLDEKLKKRLREERIRTQYKQRARIRIKDLSQLILNVILIIVGLICITGGSVGVSILLEIKDAKNNQDPASSTSQIHLYYIGAHLCAVVVGVGVFFEILGFVGFYEDYKIAKKKSIDRVIKEDQEKAAAIAATNANLNVFQMLVLNAKKKKE